MGDRRPGDRDRSPVRPRAGRTDCRVFVSNLPYDYRWQDLKDLFRKEIGEVAFVELFSDENDKSKGCGIVEFESTESVKKAIEKLHRYDIDGRKIIVKEDNGAPRERYGSMRAGRDRDREDRWEGGRDLPSSKPYTWGETYGLSPNFLEGLGIAPPLVCRVFIANLDYKVTEKKLREVFKLAGKVRDVELSVDADGKSRGFAVVEYDHPVESVQAISMLHNQPLYDRRLTVRMDRVDPLDTNNRLPEGLHNIGMGLGANGAPLRDVAKNLPSLASVGNNLNNLQTQNSFNNLTAAAALSAAAVPPLAGLQQQAALHAAAALNTGNNSLLGPAGNLDLLARTTGDLAARDLALSNLASLGGNLVNQNNLNSTLGSGAGNNALGNQAPARDGFGERDLRSLTNSNFGGVSGRNNILSSSGPKSSDTVIVDNLPHNFTWQNLKDKFRDVGNIKFAEMKGKLGLVRFASEWEALRAVSLMNNARIDGQPIDVRLF
ncbi:hypothetical protein RUM44_005990 [Polyplax serrata]|uniref:RRM domain-containing protein n=1 Tax=Polyplax serrata TaxID=468196 RepID=A0ABR1AYN6_POLSC